MIEASWKTAGTTALVGVTAATGGAMAATVLDVATATPAFAANCGSSAYDCTNPQTAVKGTTCADTASTAKTTLTPYGQLELRYSSACRTVWGRFDVTSTLDNLGVQTNRPTDTFGHAMFYGNDKYWSEQLDDADVVGRSRANPFSGGSYYYTDWY